MERQNIISNEAVLVAAFEFPNYLRRIQISKAQRASYYTWNGIDIKSKGKRLLKKYINKNAYPDIESNGGRVEPSHMKKEYCIGYFKKHKLVALLRPSKAFSAEESIIPKGWIIDGYTCYIDLGRSSSNFKSLTQDSEAYVLDQNLEKVIANATKAGQPRYHIISGQDLYSGLNPFIRTKIVDSLKEYYYKILMGYDFEVFRSGNSETSPPYLIHLEIHDTIKSEFDTSKKGDGRRWDVGNRAFPYMKTFLDFISTGYEDFKAILEDDDRLNIAGESVIFIPIKEGEQRKLVFKLFKI